MHCHCTVADGLIARVIAWAVSMGKTMAHTELVLVGKNPNLSYWATSPIPREQLEGLWRDCCRGAEFLSWGMDPTHRETVPDA